MHSDMPLDSALRKFRLPKSLNIVNLYNVETPSA